MYTAITVWDAQHINSVGLDDLVYPLQKFDWTYPIIGDDVQRPFSAGRYDTRKSVDAMTIDCEGLIIGATTALYWTKRKALMAVVVPPIQQVSTEYRHSYIEITLDDSTTYHADVVLSSFSCPVAALGSPTISPFMFSWTCNKGYWLSSSEVATRL